MPRTTLNLDKDVLTSVRSYSGNRAIPLGKAVSELVRRGLTATVPTREVNGIRVFDLPPGSPKITSALVKDLESKLE